MVTMPTIPHTLSDRSQMILMVLYETNQKLGRKELRKFLTLSPPMISGSYREAFQLFSKVGFLIGTDDDRPLNKELSGLEYIGLLDVDGDNTFDSDFGEEEVHVSLTDEGKRIAEALTKNRKPIFRPQVSSLTTVFIACAFGHTEIDELSSKHFFSACENLGYEAVRVDMTEPSQTITERIMEGITEAACVIADLTYARPSVYFEVGYSVGLGIPLVLTCRNDHYHGQEDDQRVHFDLEQYKISFWEQNNSGEFQWPKSMEPFARLSLILPLRNH
jgi:DNA-binding MarR family transcriptional regulator